MYQLNAKMREMPLVRISFEEVADDNSAQHDNFPSVNDSSLTQPSKADSSVVLASFGL